MDAAWRFPSPSVVEIALVNGTIRAIVGLLASRGWTGKAAKTVKGSAIFGILPLDRRINLGRMEGND
jgi:hypothetical protein